MSDSRVHGQIQRKDPGVHFQFTAVMGDLQNCSKAYSRCIVSQEKKCRDSLNILSELKYEPGMPLAYPVEALHELCLVFLDVCLTLKSSAALMGWRRRIMSSPDLNRVQKWKVVNISAKIWFKLLWKKHSRVKQTFVPFPYIFRDLRKLWVHSVFFSLIVEDQHHCSKWWYCCFLKNPLC